MGSKSSKWLAACLAATALAVVPAGAVARLDYSKNSVSGQYLPSPANLVPLLPAQNPGWWEGAAAIFANCAFLLCGFQAVSQVVEEKSARLPFSALFRILVLTVVAASGFYCVVVIGTFLIWFSGEAARRGWLR